MSTRHQIGLGVKLASRDGHSAWRDPELRALAVADGGGYGLAVDCDLGCQAPGVPGVPQEPLTHWLAPDPGAGKGALTFVTVAYAWPSATAAFAALDAYRAQTAQAFTIAGGD